MEIAQHVLSHKLTLCRDTAAHPVYVSMLKALLYYPQVIQTV